MNECMNEPNYTFSFIENSITFLVRVQDEKRKSMKNSSYWPVKGDNNNLAKLCALHHFAVSC